MSCSFWLRRKKAAAKKQQLKAETTFTETEKSTISEKETVEMQEKPVKKGGAKNVNNRANTKS